MSSHCWSPVPSLTLDGISASARPTSPPTTTTSDGQRQHPKPTAPPQALDVDSQALRHCETGTCKEGCRISLRFICHETDLRCRWRGTGSGMRRCGVCCPRDLNQPLLDQGGAADRALSSSPTRRPRARPHTYPPRGVQEGGAWPGCRLWHAVAESRNRSSKPLGARSEGRAVPPGCVRQ